QQVEPGGFHLLLAQVQNVSAKGVAQAPAVEHEGKLEGAGELRLDTLEHLVGEALGLEAGRVGVRATLQRTRAPSGANDVFHLGRRVAQPRQRRWDRGVDDLEVTAAR